ncbi:uncharacterized protein LOC121732820 [Aricia agestis]|uniref:uncharacterized protein LOC121732820 n=1 Tax=Aricia agestis TaxID=91739 RepID=UPI001C207F25|nr:uncharacterized protein LOC121732820 [Aricia agestis]
MATKTETEYPPSPANESDEAEQDNSDEETNVNQNNQNKVSSNVADILARLKSTGALVKKPKQEYRCFTCDLDFSDLEDRDNHIIQHVSLPDIILDRLPSDDEDFPSADENWSDEDDMPPPPKTPQKIDISQMLKKTGLSIKKPDDNGASKSSSALNKLSGLGFTIKKTTPTIKTEKPDSEAEQSTDVMEKLNKLGGIKLKLKSDGINTNTFKVVNGLKDFKTSDDEENENDNSKEDQDDVDENDKSGGQEDSGGDENSGDEQNNQRSRNNSESDSSEQRQRNIPNLKVIQGKIVAQRNEITKTPIKISPQKFEEKPIRTQNRPAVKQTPKRADLPITSKEVPKPEETSKSIRKSISSTPERRESNENSNNVVVKQEVQDPDTAQSTQSNPPLFSGQIKSERASPTLPDSSSTPVLARVKSEPDTSHPTNTQTLFSQQNVTNNQPSSQTVPAPIPAVPKTEDMTIIEINGDSNDEDDDCCVVSATPAPDVKPIVPKVESLPAQSLPPPYSTSVATSQSSYSTTPTLQSRLTSASTEKQHTFNWNAPDSKPPIDMLDKSTDDLFDSLLMSSAKKEGLSLSDASEYISLDTLGPQHSCEVCNTRFTNISLLEEHKRMSGHSSSLVAPSSSTILPYSSSSNILSSLLPVKHLAEQVGKLSSIGNSGSGFTHQQNVMINIQAYPGGGNVMVPPQSYNQYPSGQNVHGSYPQQNMYGNPGQPMAGQGMPGQMPSQPMAGQYQAGNYNMTQGYGQFQTQMPNPPYPGTMPTNSYANTSSAYSSASPLQSMQQAVYGQSPMMNQQSLSMGPPGLPSSQSYVPTSSPSVMKPPTSGNIRIQNVQTFPPAAVGLPNHSQDMSGQTVRGQLPGPTPIRMAAGASITGSRPRMPAVRGQRPTIRSGVQVHGQVRGGKMGPRMPMKRGGGAAGGPGAKRRQDMLLPGKHDNEDCQVMAMQKQREGLPMIHSVQGAKDKLNLGSQISVTKKTVNKEANAMANVLASRGISIKQKQKSRSPTPERPIPHIPNLGAGMSIKHTSKSSNFSIPEAKVGGGMLTCKICKKMFMNHNSLQVHMSNAHPQSKVPVFKCDQCPASYPKTLQLQHHKRVFHNITGPNRELGIPVVDLSQEDNLQRLSSIGIYSFIPLANRETVSGCFGIPVISVHNMQNGITANLEALGADGLLSLGPLKPLKN